jgi:hypothetical protein
MDTGVEFPEPGLDLPAEEPGLAAAVSTAAVALVEAAASMVGVGSTAAAATDNTWTTCAKAGSSLRSE